MTDRLIAGAMSGTSADGVDVAIVAVRGHGADMAARLVHHHHHPYERNLRRQIADLRQGGSTELHRLARCGRDITMAYAAAVRDALRGAGRDPNDLTAVAAHGQTLFHQPPDTIQWIDPALLAYETGCAVVSDFRRADCAAGGQGAPLVPFADYILFRHPNENRALVNIGGIANITLLPAGAGLDALAAFDTGPGNCISDHLVARAAPDGPGIDVDGQIAARGTVHQPLLDALIRHPYFARPAPKSTDGPEMLALWRQAVDATAPSLPLESQLASACALTAWAIAAAVDHFSPHQVIVSGGGVRNRTLLRELRDRLGPRTALRTTDELGVPSEAKEAIAFGLLGAATLDGLPSNVPSCTGARRAVVLGSVTPKP